MALCGIHIPRLRVSTELVLQDEVGKGAFQELDQVAAARQLCKFAARATSAAAVPGIIQQAFEV